MTTPKRIQLRRTKGWRMPPNTICVTRPGKWGNPFKSWTPNDAAGVVEKYKQWLKHSARGQALQKEARAELRGKNLACWCRIEDEAGNRVPCHADTLLALANSP